MHHCTREFLALRGDSDPLLMLSLLPKVLAPISPGKNAQFLSPYYPAQPWPARTAHWQQARIHRTERAPFLSHLLVSHIRTDTPRSLVTKNQFHGILPRLPWPPCLFPSIKETTSLHTPAAAAAAPPPPPPSRNSRLLGWLLSTYSAAPYTT
ncbi:hypothetical protein LX36DRAFT_318944 [Colletotrichum falcatum]|nr:hypothetical protein LX36DRAFT_318944 [Colletotrichum falcatum]